MCVVSEPTTANTRPSPVPSYETFREGDLSLTIKGAPDVLLGSCTHVVTRHGGAPIALTHEARQRLVEVQERWASKGRRVLVLARRIIPAATLQKNAQPGSDAFEEAIQALIGDLVIVGLVGLIDPLKHDIPETVRIVRGAGVRFFVVTGKLLIMYSLHRLSSSCTGDHPATAVAIAEQAGIISNAANVHHFEQFKISAEVSDKPLATDDHSSSHQGVVITGPQLDQLSSAQEDVSTAGCVFIDMADTVPLDLVQLSGDRIRAYYTRAKTAHRSCSSGTWQRSCHDR